MLDVDHLHVGRVGHVHRGNDLGHAAQVVAIVSDHQRVVAGIHVDGVVGTDQRAQDGHQVVGILKIEFENLGGDLAVAHGIAREHRPALELGIGLGHDLVQTRRVHYGVALQAQHRQELVVGHSGRHGAVGGQCDGAFDPGVDHHIAAGEGGHSARHGFDIGVGEIQRDGLTALDHWRRGRLG